jgi:hypothetical protein
MHHRIVIPPVHVIPATAGIHAVHDDASSDDAR